MEGREAKRRKGERQRGGRERGKGREEEDQQGRGAVGVDEVALK